MARTRPFKSILDLGFLQHGTPSSGSHQSLMARKASKAASHQTDSLPADQSANIQRNPSKKRAPEPETETWRKRARPSTQKTVPKSEEESDLDEVDGIKAPSKSKASPRKRVKEEADQEELPEKSRESGKADKKPRTPSKRKTKDEQAGTKAVDAGDQSKDNKPKKRRKTKEEKEAESMPLADRTLASLHRIGAHVSSAGGCHNSITNALHVGGNSFALFLKSQRKWENPPLKPEHVSAFHDLLSKHQFDATKHIVPHGSYLVNLAANEKAKADQAYAGFIDDLKRCEQLGIVLYNFHPGNTNGLPRDEAIGRVAAQLDRAHKETAARGAVVTLLENMAAPPTANNLGATFEDLRDIIGLVEDKERIGVCLDTCHLFAAGYDLRTPEALEETLRRFDETVGFQYLRALHLNDSKGMFRSHRDLHQNIGLGFLGLRAFHAVMNEPRFHGLPMVLETPIDRKDDRGKDVEDKGIWAKEIKLLESLVGMDAEGEDFKKLEKGLADAGASERKKLQEQFERKEAEKSETSKKGKKGKKNAKRSQESEDEDSEG